MSRSAATASRSRRASSAGPSGCTSARSGVTTSAASRPSTTRCATRAASVAVSSSRSSASPAGSPTRPPPSPYQLRCRMDAASSSRRRASADRGAGCPACSIRSSVRSAASCGSCGGRTGATRPTRARARSDHSRTRSGRPSASADRSPSWARSRPWPTRVLCRSRLPNDDCQACRSVSPARTWRRATDGRPRASASSACTSRQCRRTASGSRSRTRIRRTRSAASSSSPRVVASRAAWSRSGSASRRSSRACRASASASMRRSSAGDRLSEGHLGDHGEAVGAQGRQLAVLGAEAAGRPAGHHPGPGRVAAQQGLGQRQLALGLEPPQPAGAVRRGRGLERPGGLAGHPRRHQHLGAVLLDRGAVGRRQRSQHVAGVVHPAQRGDQVAAQELDVAEVEARLGLLDARSRPRRTGPRRR